jgi:superfamily II DNA/RNA helicase
VLIFCETKREVDRIGNSGLIPLSLDMLHGDIKQFQREIIFKKFKNGHIDCLVATNVAARGLDFPEIDLIIQMEPPKNTEIYIHRSGRTGRAGKSGTCVTLYCFKEENTMKNI